MAQVKITKQSADIMAGLIIDDIHAYVLANEKAYRAWLAEQEKAAPAPEVQRRQSRKK